jgi:hypothetical protein
MKPSNTRGSTVKFTGLASKSGGNPPFDQLIVFEVNMSGPSEFPLCRVSARFEIAMTSSLQSTGFGTNRLNPAANARARSSTLTKAVNATAGICCPVLASISRTLVMSE